MSRIDDKDPPTTIGPGGGSVKELNGPRALTPASDQASVDCRLIADDIVDQVVDCLERGFPERPRTYWVNALDCMSKRAPIQDYPRYGYALVAKSRIVGVILMFFSRSEGKAEGDIRCNLSSWCVDKEYRSCALSLHMLAVKYKEVTYLNISPAVHTQRTIEALGFRRYTGGQIFFVPILSRPQRNVRVSPFTAEGPHSALLSESEHQLLTEHAAMGCRTLVCQKDGVAYPFVFLDRVVFRGLIPCPHLIYCRSTDEFVRFAQAIGRYLLLRTGPFCVIDAKGPMDGLMGRYFPDRAPRYFKGPAPPGVGDLAYTELPILGP
jgi:hypothetical protein